MKKIFIFIPVLLGLFFSSCQKEVDGSLPDNVQNDSTYLDRLIMIDTTIAAPADTFMMIKYIYDSRKRVSKHIYLAKNGNSWDTASTNEFYYLGNDTLPYKAKLAAR